MYMINALSMGNMGGANTVCSQIPNGVPGALVNLACPVGTLNTFALDSETEKPLI